MLLNPFFTALAVLLPALCATAISTTQQTECSAVAPNGPVIVTIDCIDPEYHEVIIDSETDEESPVRHHKVSAHFNESNISINIYLPPRSQWEGRFFQMVYPTQEAEALDVNIAFAIDSGGYTVQITGTTGYRADAAAAKFSRGIAVEYYDHRDQHIYGYIFGGSGGSLQTIGAIENTYGVWDGAVPIIQAIPISFMNNPTVRCLAGMALNGKKEQIASAVSPGGLGNPFSDLTCLERRILHEATAMGVPLQAWEDFDAVPNYAVMDSLRGVVQGMDPTYADEFWNTPGYLGTEQSELGDMFRSRKVDFETVITAVQQTEQGDYLLALEATLEGFDETGLDFFLVATNGTVLGPLGGTPASNQTLSIRTATTAPTTIAALAKGLSVRIDNRWFIAMHAYYRHQVPERDGFYGYDQFRDSSGEPIYPQRPIDTSATVARSTSGGGIHTGNITAKVIAVNNLVDYDAFPWHASWYETQVRKSLGDRFDDNYRLWFNENADHNFGPMPAKWLHRLVDFTGIYHQALRDLAAWVEDGMPAPGSTMYTISNSNQFLIPESASERFGIQPSVKLTSVSSPAEVGVGEEVRFLAHAETPVNAGVIVSMEWDFLGNGSFIELPFGHFQDKVDASVSFVYEQRGLFTPAVRVASQREGNATNPNRRVMNLDRLQVKVI